MLKLKKIAITGGIASGKSTVCRILQEHGAYHISCDAIVHRLITQDKSCIQQIINLLSPDVLVNGAIDRKKVAEKVFDDRDKLKGLENILHPRLFEEIEKEYKRAQKGSIFVVEIPLVQEIGKSNFFDVIVAVVCEETLAQKRYAQADYEKRMKRQWSPEKKSKHADFTLTNNGTLKELEQEVNKLLAFLNNSGE